MPVSPVDSAARSLDTDRLRRAKKAYTTRHLDLGVARSLIADVRPDLGDLVLAVIESIGQHPRVEQCDGRRATLFPGDEVVVAYGHRYAPDQFEAAIPEDLGPCELVAAGGVAGKVQEAHGRMSAATTLRPVGLLVDGAGQRLNVRDGAISTSPICLPRHRPVTLAVVGASMNSGKTTTAAYLVRGLCSAGIRVGAAKVTGTGAGGDVWLLMDSGASPVYDFTLAGLPSTYRVGDEEVCRVFAELTDRLAGDGCEAIVIEVADGVFQQETAGLLQNKMFAERVDALVFAASDAMGACAGAEWLRERGMLPVALSGVLSSSPLATREAEAATGLQVWGLERLGDAGTARALYEDLRSGRSVRGAQDAPDPTPVVEHDLAHSTLIRAV